MTPWEILTVVGLAALIVLAVAGLLFIVLAAKTLCDGGDMNKKKCKGGKR